MLETRRNQTIKRRPRKMLAVLFAVILLVQCMIPSVFAAVTVETVGNAGSLIAAGQYYCMALKANGTVTAWGDNNDGQCDVPTGLGDVVAISAGTLHSMALMANGTVTAWGENTYGQCDVPIGLNDVVAIAAGGSHSMALKSDGTVTAWGNNNYGQCVVPTGLNGVVAIATGVSHSMALKSDGTIVAWGNNNDGRCDVPTGLNDVIAIAAGFFHSVALKADGTVTAWGFNNASVCDVPTNLNDVVAIAAGGIYNMALKSDGTIVAWGHNSYNQCDVPIGLNDVIAIAAGGYHSLALKADGNVAAWGRNDNGQCNVPSGLNLCGRYLNNIMINNGVWPFDFDLDATNYTLEVPNAVDSMSISPFADNDIQIRVQGDTKASGSATNITLNIGETTITIDTVDTSTGLKCPYTIAVNRATPDTTNAKLNKLETGTGVLSPAFDPDTTDYTVSVGNTISSIDITACPEDGNATTAINGKSAGSEEQTVSVPLDIGDNVIPIEVRAGDMTTTKEYTITAIRGPSSNAGLSALSVGTGNLSPAFDADTVAYSVQTAGSIRSIDITAVTAQTGAELAIGEKTAQSGTPTSISLANGANLIPIVITAPDGATQKSYIISVNGTVSDADLSGLSVSGHSLGETFMPNKTAYTVGVDNGASSIEVTAETSDSKALMIIDGAVVDSGDGTDIPLDEGENVIGIMVVAQDASTKTYTLTVTREETLTITTDSLPEGVVEAPYSFSPGANGGDGSYTWSILGLPDTLTYDVATGKISGTPTETGSCDVEVTVKDSSNHSDTKTFTLAIYQTFHIDLEDLSISEGTLSPSFDPDTVVYNVTGISNLTEIGITAETAGSGQTLSINGHSATSDLEHTVSLTDGQNLIPIVVTYGGSQKSYIISVNGMVSDADLKSLSVSGHSLNETFTPNKTAYTVGVGNSASSIKVTATTSDSKALMIIDGAIVGSGDSTAIPLDEGENTVDIMVVAQDGTSKTYTVTVTREGTMSISTDSLPIGIIGAAYSETLAATGGSGGYTWRATGLPDGFSLSTGGVLSGTPKTGGRYSIKLTVTDAHSNTVTKTLTLTIKKGCGNGAYVIESDGDSAYTGSYSSDGLLQLTVNSGVKGFTYFSVDISAVSGHSGNEICVFVQTRNEKQIGFSFIKSDFDSENTAGAAFNVQPGDVIEVYIVGALSNNAGESPVVL